MTLGEKIRDTRKKKGLTQSQLAEAVGVVQATISSLENDQMKGPVDPDLIVLIAGALEEDKTIRTAYLENNSVYRSFLPKVFTDLNCIREDPAIVLTSFIGEAEESIEAAKILVQIFRNADPTRTPNYREIVLAKMEQLLDVMRNGEIAFEKMIKLGVLTEEDRILIYDRQQRKCEEKGHHCPQEAA